MKTHLKRGLLISSVFALSASVLAPAALAERGGGGGRVKSDIWITTEFETRSTDSDLHHGDQVEFGYVTSYFDADFGTGPWLRLECYIDGAQVYWENRAGFEGGYRYGEPFSLGPSLAWPSGAADCKGVLGHMHHKNGKFVTEAVIDFPVVP